jgi:hypothetical protein
VAALVATKPFVGVSGAPLYISAISWDASRGLLWGATTAAANPIEIWLFDISGPNAVGTFQFSYAPSGLALTDGLAWDSNDDTLYLSPDVDCNVYQYSLGTGVNPPLGTLMNTIAPQNAAGEADCSVSGVAIGAGNTLYIGRNGNAQIRRVDKTTGVFISDFATTQGRVEDLVCDPVTYAPLEAILAKDSNADLYEAFEVDTDTCPLAVEGIAVSIDIKFCSDPNAFNCKKKGVLPVTIFGTEDFDVEDIDVSSLQLCTEDLSSCTNAPRDYSIADRGDPTSDLGATMCAIIEVEEGIFEEQDYLNQDGFLDLDAAFEASEVQDMLGTFCSDVKGATSEPLIITGTTLDGTTIFSVPLPNVGTDQLWKANK